ncbi:MAG: Fe-S cluster assembly protein IscX [Nitrospirae bacterium]|nr:Fe-S cluster assembly protein IscX [Nitrospirota bacterium]MBI3606071.1 Fe-S cluster assembly protein IscX [Nitrospirota bacterium]
MDWSNIEDIAISLAEQNPDKDPLTVRFTEMHKSIISLPGFTGDPMKSNEKILESIQMAWYQEYQDARK